MIKIRYTGSYPTTCMGKLIIYRNGKRIYNSGKYSFYSTGSAGFDNEGHDHIEAGKLIWREKDKEEFEKWLEKQPDKEEISQKVEKELEKVSVCCGGCI
ncbi:MAG: hypothetical protein ACOCT9_01615 [archaeon]